MFARLVEVTGLTPEDF
jgi:hypothetical protein